MKHSWPSQAFVSLIILITWALTGSADTITLKEGRVVEGTIVKATKDSVEIEVARGDMKAVSFYARSEIGKIEYAPSPAASLEKEYEARLANTGGTADEWHALGRWCTEQFLAKKAKAAYWKSIELDPNHESAWRALGYVFHDGRWVTEEQAMLAKGFVRHKGKWMAPEERNRLVEIERKKEEMRIAEVAARQAKIDAYREEIRSRALDRRIVRMEKKMEREINKHTYDSSYDPAFHPERRTVYVPVIVGVPAATEESSGTESSTPSISISGRHRFKRGHVTFDLNF
ncbi:hypothetical protein ACFL01_01495 [Planctomycetota bacterium]